MTPSITVVTPWQNHRELERDYWAAIQAADAQTIIVDDGSDPPLPNGWRIEHPSGFCHACNTGLQLAQTDAVLFLNNDIAATRTDWLQNIADQLEDGVLVGANLVYSPHADIDGQQLPYLDGWCLAGMRHDLLELGGFDESLDEPAYYSDNLLCLEARAAGMTLREINVGLRHKRNVTAGSHRDNLAVTLANQTRYRQRAAELLALV
jgi:GT2 family glycosyltransferase